jgi:hypothetical protein
MNSSAVFVTRTLLNMHYKITKYVAGDLFTSWYLREVGNSLTFVIMSHIDFTEFLTMGMTDLHHDL